MLVKFRDSWKNSSEFDKQIPYSGQGIHILTRPLQGYMGGFRPTGAKALNHNAFALTERIYPLHRRPRAMPWAMRYWPYRPDLADTNKFVSGYLSVNEAGDACHTR